MVSFRNDVVYQKSNFKPFPTFLRHPIKIWWDFCVAGEGSSSEMSETFNGVDHSEDSNAFNSSDDPQQGSGDVRELGNLSPVASGIISSVPTEHYSKIAPN